MKTNEGRITYINGPVIKGVGMASFQMREMVLVGEKKLIGEVISIEGDVGTLQVYEETEGLEINKTIIGLEEPLSIKLGPGLMGNIFDGIGRPLEKIHQTSGDFIPEGIGLFSIVDLDNSWEVRFLAKEGDEVREGQLLAEIQETSRIMHRIMVPPGVGGKITGIKDNGIYKVEDVLLEIEDESGNNHKIKMVQSWPVRKTRPVEEKLKVMKPLVTGQRILDIFFPIAKGGTAAIPGGFGTGKTMTQHQLAKWSDADIIIYIGCGERGNEMTDVLQEFPKIIDQESGKSIMERTVLIANTSNMPVAAREASIYTGVTMAEYYRDMGYHVAIMADSTSRWAEALREISGRLEEMPAEGGYPAYLASRLAEFYERAGYAKVLQGVYGSVTIIGAVSPAGGDFSEPVTENTKRYVNTFLALDKKLAYARHYPAINWLVSYSGYIKILKEWYEENVGEDVLILRDGMLKLLQEESKLLDIVQLVGEDVLPDSQRLILEIARIFKIGFLQQNAFHKEDTYVPLEKQYAMLKLIVDFNEILSGCVKLGIPISQVKNPEIFNRVIKMKYDIPNDDLSGIEDLRHEIEIYYEALKSKYTG
ncbi:MAG: V-type ATP synthase subunit A [Peptostreptococcaceae bacterium]|nr:V-type ATP synthase subunit A [Peptostreptococcaceae bacterium]